MAVNTILSIALLSLFSSVLTNPTSNDTTVAPGNNGSGTPPDVQDYLTDEQKEKICDVYTEDDLCTDGMNDTLCWKIALAVNGTNPICVQFGVCSFVVTPSNSSTTTGKTTTTTAMPSTTTALSTTPAPAPVTPEPNTVYVTDAETSCIPSNFNLIIACDNDGDYVFVYPKTAGATSTSTTSTTNEFSDVIEV